MVCVILVRLYIRFDFFSLSQNDEIGLWRYALVITSAVVCSE